MIKLFQLFGLSMVSQGALPAEETAETFNLFCKALTGVRESECVEGTCTLVKDVADCSAERFDTVARRYNELSDIIVTSIQQDVRLCADLDFPSYMIGDYSQYLKMNNPRDARDFHRQDGTTFGEAVLECLGGSTKAVRSLIEVYLTIPGNGWVRNYSSYNVDVMDTSRLPEFPMKLIPRALNIEKAVRPAAFSGQFDLLDSIRYLPPYVQNLIYRFKTDIAVVVSMQKVVEYFEAHELVRFTDDDYESYGEAVLDAIKNLDVLVRRMPEELDEYAKQNYAFLYGAMMKSALSLRPKGFSFRSLTDRKTWYPIRHRKPFSHPAISFDDRMAALTREENLLTGIFSEPSFGMDLSGVPRRETLHAVYDFFNRCGLSIIQKRIILSIYADMLRRSGLGHLDVIPKEDTVKHFVPRPEHYYETVIILISELRRTRSTPAVDSVPVEVIEDFIRLIRLVGLERIEIDYMNHQFPQKYSLGYFGYARFTGDDSYMIQNVYADDFFDCSDLRAYVVHSWLVQFKEMIDVGIHHTDYFMGVQAFDQRCQTRLFRGVHRITGTPAAPWAGDV